MMATISDQNSIWLVKSPNKEEQLLSAIDQDSEQQTLTLDLPTEDQIAGLSEPSRPVSPLRASLQRLSPE